MYSMYHVYLLSLQEAQKSPLAHVRAPPKEAFSIEREAGLESRRRRSAEAAATRLLEGLIIFVVRGEKNLVTQVGRS